MNSFDDIVKEAKQKGAKRIAVPAPTGEDIEILSQASAAGLILPVLIGDARSLQTMTGKKSAARTNYEIIPADEPQDILRLALEQIKKGEADILMQGGIAPQTMLDALQDKTTGLKISRTISCVSIFQHFKENKLILVTDTFCNNSPHIAEKQVILENALGLARMLEIPEPKVAALAAIEQINPAIPSTLDAAILSKMSDRRQFGKAIVDGPIDIDCAVSRAAAARKGLKSMVTGDVDIFVVPEIDTGYLFAESLAFFGRMRTAGIILGIAVPVILNIPFVARNEKMVEIALACLMCRKGNESR